jgi:hypothetical protein
VNSSEFETYDILIIGSLIHAGRPTQAIQNIRTEIPSSAFKSANAIVFDTRFSIKIVGIFGYAARKIVICLERNRWRNIIVPQVLSS